MKKYLILCILGAMIFTGCQGQGAENKNEAVQPSNEILAENDEDDYNEGFEMDKNPVAGVKLQGFEAKTLEGEVVKEDVFEKSKITAINLWGTFCSPCIEEMPDLEKVYGTYNKEDFNIIGIVVDGEQSITAKEIVKKLGVTYTNIIADEKLSNDIVNKFDYVPATIFVNNKGEVLDTFIPGGTDEKSIKKIIDGLLENEK
jgi:thiol-disulfide isomerase/thioredoxin